MVPGDPADEAGIRTNDIILEIDDTQINGSRALTAQAGGLAVGDRVDVTLLRDGKKKTLTLKVGRRPLTMAQTGSSGSAKDTEYGIQVTDLTPELARQLNIADESGAVVTGIKPGSKAAKAGLQEGDVIVEVNRQHVDSAKDFAKRVHKNIKGDDLNLLVKRGQSGLRVIPLG